MDLGTHGPSTIPPVPFSALIFDFDGLIIDSETPLFRIWQEI